VTFLNLTLLFGLAAAAVPLLLHLLAKKEPKQVVFPSIRLLTQRMETNRSKIRIRRWWLLALRIAVLSALAIALARPAIAGSLSLTWTTIGILAATGVGALLLASLSMSRSGGRRLAIGLLAVGTLVLLAAVGWGGYTAAAGKKPPMDQATPVALAIVVDNAPLSAWRGDGETHLDRLREAARELIEATHSESRIAVLDRSSTPAAFALDVSGALSRVGQIETLEVVQPLESRIEAATRLLQTSQIESRQVVLLSGLAESSFQVGSGGSESAASSGLDDLFEEVGARLTIWDSGAYDGTNRTLQTPTLSDQSPAPDSPISVATTISFRGEGPAIGERLEDATGVAADTGGPSNDTGGASTGELSTTAECVLFPASASLPVVRDGEIVRPEAKAVDRVSVDLNAGTSIEIRMTLPPLPVGLHHGAIRLVGEDSLSFDDAAYFTVSVLPPSRLLIAGDQMQEAEEIAWSMTAPQAIDDPAAQYAIQFVPLEDLATSRLSGFEAVVLLDPTPAALSDPALSRYRDEGGSVWVIVGKQLGVDPVDVTGFPIFQRPWRVPDPGTFLELSAPSHPAVSTLASMIGEVPFQDFRIDQYWRIEPREMDQVLLRFAGTGHPAMIELGRNVGEETSSSSGRTIVMTTPIPELADPLKAWNELFSAEEPWPAFLLVRDVVRYLSGRVAEQWMYSVGSPVTLVLETKQDETAVARRLQWFPPVGQTAVPVDVSEQVLQSAKASSVRILLGRPKHSGVHWVRGDRTGLGFTVNLPRAVLDPTEVSKDQLERVFGTEHVRRIETLEEMDWTSGEGPTSVPLWSPLMLLALIVFLAEQVLSNRFYRDRKAAGRSSLLSAGKAA
jgi:hypothetical protein